MYRLVPVYRCQLSANWTLQRHRIARGRAHPQRHRPPILLQIRDVDVRRRIAVEAPVSCATDNTDDLP